MEIIYRVSGEGSPIEHDRFVAGMVSIDGRIAAASRQIRSITSIHTDTYFVLYLLEQRGCKIEVWTIDGWLEV